MIQEATAPENQVAALFQKTAQALVTSLDLGDLLTFIVDEAMAFLNVDIAILRLLDRPGEHL